MTTGILLLNFGEPERSDPEAIVPFLEAIFTANARLEHAADPEAGRQRARQLAERRAPGVAADFRRMGASPLHRQTAAQARALDVELRQRAFPTTETPTTAPPTTVPPTTVPPTTVTTGMQFTAPSIHDGARELRASGAERVVALPLYPLCGPSTTVFALDALRAALRDLDWSPDVVEISGWHRHPEYAPLRARAVRMYCERSSLDLADPSIRLVFSAHGTPMKYLREGSRYDRYVRDHCAQVAAELGVGEYDIGFQNHENRPGVEWTEPEIVEAVRSAAAERVVVVPVSFMQELSETLVELDLDLRDEAEAVGLDFHRVPVPYDDPAFIALLADLVEEACATDRRACRCRPGAFCLNDSLKA